MPEATEINFSTRWWSLARRAAAEFGWTMRDRWRRATTRVEVWSIAIYQGDSPFRLTPARGTRGPVLRAEDVTDAVALFVADPFMVHDGNRWVMFFEIFNLESQQGEIAVAQSSDGITWTYDRIVLAEAFHLSYPYVFHWQGEWYMIPESSRIGAVRLYRALDFPHRWQFERQLLDQPFVDSSVVRHEDHWWLFTAPPPPAPGMLRLFYATALDQPWREHPLSPLLVDERSTARPGGRIIQADGRLFRIAQDGLPRYGSRLHAFEITKLTTTEYEERSAAANPILQGADRGWNATGMHHLDAHRLADGHWLAVVDGHRLRRELIHMRGLNRRVRAKELAASSIRGLR